MQIPRSLYPFDGKYLDRGGLRMHYLDEGQGDPVVMVHGNPTWSFFYRSLVLALRTDHQVIVPDHIGMGLSDKPGDDRYGYRLQDRIDDLEALLDSLALSRKITLVLHDWGGMIGMGYAGRHPERIGRLILLNTAAFHLPRDQRLPATIAFCRNTGMGQALVRGLNLFSRGASRMCTTRPLSRAVRDAYCAPYDSWHNRIGTLRFVQDIPLVPSDPSYAQVTAVQEGLGRFVGCPTLFCWGDRDFVFTPDVLRHWQTLWPHADVQRLPDAGHYLLDDAPDAVATRVRTFLQQHPLARDG